jgi:hypothetical protein
MPDRRNTIGFPDAINTGRLLRHSPCPVLAGASR